MLFLSVGGIVVSIAAFQAVDPGSIPGHRSPFNIIIIHDVCIVQDRRPLVTYRISNVSLEPLNHVVNSAIQRRRKY